MEGLAAQRRSAHGRHRDGCARTIAPRATIQLGVDGSKPFELHLPRGRASAESSSAHHRLSEVSHINALLVHSLGAVLVIILEGPVRRLNHRRRSPEERGLGLLRARSSENS